ncbi:MAG: hypothetical protein RL739_293, partial [Pseudomonadota bacterium]
MNILHLHLHHRHWRTQLFWPVMALALAACVSPP